MPEEVTRRQHWVPKFYLRRFANAQNTLHILDRVSGRLLSPKGPTGLCQEEFFYGQRTGEKDEISQKVEEFFRAYEDPIASVYDEVALSLTDGQISDEQRYALATFMSMIWLRGPQMREQINTVAEQVYRFVERVSFAHPSIERFFDEHDKKSGEKTTRDQRDKIKEIVINGEYDRRFDNTFHLRMLEEIPKFASLFFYQDWVVFVSRNKTEFSTSDNPLAVVEPDGQRFIGTPFLDRTHCLPVTPRVLVMCRYPRIKGSRDLHRKLLFAGREREVHGLNLITSRRAIKRVYSREKATLEEILAQASEAWPPAR